MNIENILQQKNLKKTKVRIELLSLLQKSCSPISVPEILKKIASKNKDINSQLEKSPNKTTIYRQLEILKNADIVEELSLIPGVLHYEIKTHHHHHIVCSDCGKIQDFFPQEMEKELHKIEEKISQEFDFQNIKHKLEFYGTCKKCI